MTTGWMDVSNCITDDIKHATMIMGMQSANLCFYPVIYI